MVIWRSDSRVELRLGSRSSEPPSSCAGKFADAVASLKRALQPEAGASIPPSQPVEPPCWAARTETWAFSFFWRWADQRLGFRSDALQWLQKAISAIDQLEGSQLSGTASRPRLGWRERLMLTSLRGEAEAVILYDRVFPADPFAH